MKKICLIATVSMTVRAFLIPIARYYRENTDWDISILCDYDPNLAQEMPEGVHYLPVNMQRGIHFHGIQAMNRMVALFKQEKFDLVQYCTPNASFYASIAAKIAKIPVRLYCQWGIAYVGFAGLKRRIFRLIEKNVCRCSTQVEPDSFGNLRFSHAEGLYTADKSRVIFNGSASGVNLQKFDISHKEEWRAQIRERYAVPRDAVVYTFVGRITRDKGINELFAAAKTLLERHHDAYLFLVGGMEMNRSVDSGLYQWSQDEQRVICCGYTTEVEKYLAASDVYVLPSYREGFGTAVVEAEAMGIPVIVTDIPGPTEAMEKDRTGLVVQKGDTDGLLQAMETLYSAGKTREEMGRRGLEFVSERFEQKALFRKIYEDRVLLIRSSKSGAT